MAARTKAPDDALARFRAPTRAWFERALGKPTRAQALGWTPIEDGSSTLLLAPTGSGKTLAAFLVALDRLMFEPRAPRPAPRKPGERKRRSKDEASESVCVLYVSPLKALAVDVDKNLRAPLAGIAAEARREGVDIVEPTVGIRTGDTPPADRARMLRHPPDILITTPESLYLLLTSGARTTLAGVETVIVDEIHAMAGTKRGAHLFLSLERLEAVRAQAAKTRGHRPKPLQRIGLSATQRPLDEIAKLLGGYEKRKPRDVAIVDASERKHLTVSVVAPRAAEAAASNDLELELGPKPRASVWPKVHEELLSLIRAHRSTMIFVNSRRLAERLASALNDLAEAEVALAHHGSIAREKRTDIEDRLKRGELPAIVATSSLELGIDMGAVDLVVQIEAPPSIASGLQRVGRAGHQVGATSKGVLIPKHRADLLSCAAAVDLMQRLEVEETRVPRSPLDVLAQQIVATLAAESRAMRVDDLFDLVRRAAPFHDLPRRSFEGVLDMLSGRYPSERFAGLKARIVWDRIAGTVRARDGAGKLAIASGGTIPDRGLYGVYLRDADGRGGKRVGELDEEMVFELREGEVFLLGASSWRADEIGLDRVIVSPAPGEPGKMPFWHGDRPGRSRAFGEAIGKMARTVAALGPGEARKLLQDKGALASEAADDLYAYVSEQAQATGEVPSDKVIVVERFVDEMGDHRVCVLTPFGARVHAPWATAIMGRLRHQHGGDVDCTWSDDGMTFRLTSTAEPPAPELFFPSSDDIERMVTDALPESALFAARFREAAARALLLPRRQPGKRTPLWAQRRRASDLLAIASEFPTFPILLEAYRECLREVFDLPGLVAILKAIESRAMRIVTVDTRKPSPFASSVLFSFLANVIYEGDTPLAERRAQALAIDHDELRELLGEDELRKLLDPEVIAEHEEFLQRLDRKAKAPDGIFDLLLWLGDLSLDELALRVEVTPSAAAILGSKNPRSERVLLESHVRDLERARRIIPLTLAGEQRWAAAEDAARYRDALGVVPPLGLPRALLEPAHEPMLELVGRFARTHGPFTARTVAARFGIGEAPVKSALGELAGRGRIAVGAFTEHVQDTEYCDHDVLTALRRKSLARLRKQIEPASGEAFARFLLAWHGIGERRRSAEALLAVVGQLEGCPIPASVLEREVLPSRIDGFEPWDVDALCAAGEIVWAGIEPLGTGDGRIALYASEHEAALARPPARADGDACSAIRTLLERRGALFFQEIAREVGGFPADLAEALWNMVWAGEVTNDTLEPLRARLGLKSERHDSRRARPRAGPPGTEGRWSLRSVRLASTDAPSDTQKRTALARSLLDRYGIVTASAAHAEGVANGFAAVYDIYRTMEDGGRVRRGYFIAGQGGAQFALPGADERLRSARPNDGPMRTVVLAATDPANPYGAALPWPEAGETKGRPARMAGARVVLADGRLVGWIGRSAETLLTFLPDTEPERGAYARALAEALGGMVGTGKRRALLLQSIDGEPARSSSLGTVLTSAGFQLVGDGYVKRRTLEGGGFERSLPD